MAMEDFEEYTVESVVRGHHIYKAVWTPVIGEALALEVEEGTHEEEYAVAILKTGMVVGHVPRELSRIFFFSLQHGGIIQCTVTGHRKHGLGLEVPCSYTLYGKPKYIKRLVKLLSKQRQH